MNAPNDLFLPDVQSGADRRNLAIQRVGVKSLTHPMLVASVRGSQPTVATIDMFVALPAEQKGTHMSRFVDVLGNHREPLSMSSITALLAKMIERLDALVAAAQIAALFVGSRLADRWGRIAVLAPALLVYAGGLLALSTSVGPWQFVLATLTIGAGSGAARAVPVALVGDLAPAPLRGVAMGVFRTLTDVGMIAGPILLGWSASVAGFTMAFWTAAGGLVLVIPLLVGIRRVA